MGELLNPVAAPPPVAPPGTFSPPRRVREKHVISKAVSEWAGYRHRRLRPIFPLSSAGFSGGWELRQFSTQLVIAMFSMACGGDDQVPVRERDWHAEGSANVRSRGDVLHIQSCGVRRRMRIADAGRGGNRSPAVLRNDSQRARRGQAGRAAFRGSIRHERRGVSRDIKLWRASAERSPRTPSDMTLRLDYATA